MAARRQPPTSSAAELIERVHAGVAEQVERIRKKQIRTRNQVTTLARLGSDRMPNIEANIKGPDGWSLGVLCRIADALGCDLEVRLVERVSPLLGEKPPE